MINNLKEIKLNVITVIPKVDPKIIHETLSRIGICSERKKIVWPSCYLFEIDGVFAIVHFKELFQLTREDSFDDMFDEDLERKNSIIFLLDSWKLIEPIDPELISPHGIKVFVLPYSEKKFWTIEHKIKNFQNIK
jgi:hypothetical protein